MNAFTATAVLVSAATLFAAAPAARADDSSARLQFVAWSNVTGSGKLQTETRKVTGFQAIETQGSVTLVLREGTREGLELRADDNILPLIVS